MTILKVINSWCFLDADHQLHLDTKKLLAIMGCADTKENRETAIEAAKATLRDLIPNVETFVIDGIESDEETKC